MKLGDNVIWTDGDIRALAQIIIINADGSYVVSVAGLGQNITVPADKISEQLQTLQ